MRLRGGVDGGRSCARVIDHATRVLVGGQRSAVPPPWSLGLPIFVVDLSTPLTRPQRES
jgi:hypothetical protein